MATRSVTTTREYIEAAPLPVHGQSYTVISHKFVIEETLKSLASAGFEIEKELYRCNREADIAQGIYHLKYSGDPEMGLMFTWANSYDKSMRFRCATGGYVHVSENRLIAGSKTKEAWSRKHTRTADQQVQQMIAAYINNAGAYYKELVDTKEQMKSVTVPLQTRAEVLGRLFFEKNALSGEQMLIIKEQFRGKKFDYNTTDDSLWAMYNHIAYSLQKSHPRKWMDQQTLIHWFLCDFFDITDKIDPASATIMINQAKPEEKVEDVSVEAAETLDQPALVEAATEAVELNDSEKIIAEELTSTTGLDGEKEVTDFKAEATAHEEAALARGEQDILPKITPAIPIEPVTDEFAEKTALEVWLLAECKQMGVGIDNTNKFLFFKENQEVPEDVFNATVELGWTIQAALPFPEE